ncbi:decapping enzyme Dcp1, putative [Talaromyces stipitatus ATCC 10500]|uniref:Decapping enzyme Dcp1, putative n=1 Tax=Talaromyces stipitatus (strain ATCC 10500 / CBS 375.48 / QM 6759 / NRRL 1006) TaxID=441959 RepID=B8MQ13_TALSN|nr:decapping enzyme Dcp1, putative [Talaromyces stipitatus ATCC 10500]EED12903.1 decapping enzyme Dcp1, putative [Talaromyces stipitatus ATCC 10500]
MTPRKGRGGRAHNHNHNHNHNNNHHLTNLLSYNHNSQYLAQFPAVLPQQINMSDYESTDNTYCYSDTPQPPPAVASSTQQQSEPPRTNEELNISVLRRHNPNITSILSLAPSTTQLWEKNGIEGTMFICQLTQGSLGEERYSVFVLNRRGLNNFDILLMDGENVQITDEFVILKSEKNLDDGRDATDEIIGLWIFSEPPPNSTAETRKINAEVIKECATHAGRSMALAKESVAAAQQSVQMGRQISLQELFSQQRAQDDGLNRPHITSSAEAGMMNGAGGMNWSHNPAVQPPIVPSPGQLPSAVAQAMNRQSSGDVLTNLFRRAGLVNQN